MSFLHYHHGLWQQSHKHAQLNILHSISSSKTGECQLCSGRMLTLSILDKDLANIIYFAEAGTPTLLRLLCPLGAAGVPPHELVVTQGAICRALGIAPPTHRALASSFLTARVFVLFFILSANAMYMQKLCERAQQDVHCCCAQCTGLEHLCRKRPEPMGHISHISPQAHKIGHTESTVMCRSNYKATSFLCSQTQVNSSNPELSTSGSWTAPAILPGTTGTDFTLPPFEIRQSRNSTHLLRPTNNMTLVF